MTHKGGARCGVKKNNIGPQKPLIVLLLLRRQVGGYVYNIKYGLILFLKMEGLGGGRGGDLAPIKGA